MTPAISLGSGSFRISRETDPQILSPFCRRFTDWIDLIFADTALHRAMYIEAAIGVGNAIGRVVTQGEDLDELIERHALAPTQLQAIWDSACASACHSGIPQLKDGKLPS